MALPVLHTTSVPGLSLYTDYIPAKLDSEFGHPTGLSEEKIVKLLDAGTWDTDLKRRTMQFGWKYDYLAKTIRPTQPFPEWLNLLATDAHESGCMNGRPDQAIVNEYLPGQGIAAHTDSHLFGSQVASLSLLCEVPMVFADGTGKRESVQLPRRSLCVLEGKARYDWAHSIAAVKEDLVASKRGGPLSSSKSRTRRISVTLRTVGVR